MGTGVDTVAVADWVERLRARARSTARRVLWWVWPSYPTSWAAVPSRLRPPATQIVRLTVAAVVAYLIADTVSPGILDLTAPLTALLVVQATTVGTLQMGLVRVGAVLTGVLVAVGVRLAGAVLVEPGCGHRHLAGVGQSAPAGRAVPGGPDQRDAHPGCVIARARR